MIENSDRTDHSSRDQGHPASDRKTDNGEQRGYTAQNPTPLDPQQLKRPKGDTAVERPKPQSTSK